MIEPETKDSKAIFIGGVVIVLVVFGVGAISYKIHKKRKING